MKNLFIGFLVIYSQLLFAASEGQNKINSSSWSLLYGIGRNVNTQNYKPEGYSYKLLFGNRWDNNTEINFFARYSSQKDNITLANIEGEIGRTSITGGIHFGYWFFSRLNVHVGYAFHGTTNEVSGNFSSSQISTIKTNYRLENPSTKGLMAGADVVLIKGKNLQLFANYDYYRHNHKDSHDWEGMIGLRLYPGPSSGGSSASGGFFSKFFEWVFAKGKS